MPNSKAPICACNALWDCANDPENPIVFDSEMGEFHLRYRNHSMMIYHCHFCGGRAPSKSKRDTLFAQPTEKERYRLMELTKNIKTLDALFQAFGPPEHDMPVGEASTQPEKDGNPEITTYFRNLIYQNLSKTSDVRVRVYPTDRVSFEFASKYIGPKKNAG